MQRTWTVWDEMRPHRVDVNLNVLSGRTRVTVDGAEVVNLSGWRMGPGGRHVEFAVGGRRCTLVVRPHVGEEGGPEMDLHVDGWSLDTGTPLEERIAREAAEPPGVMRLVLVFLPLIGIPNLLGQARRTGDLSWAVGGGVVIAGAVLAGVGVLALGAWFAGRSPGLARTLVGWAIVLSCYVVLLGTYAALLAYAR